MILKSSNAAIRLNDVLRMFVFTGAMSFANGALQADELCTREVPAPCSTMPKYCVQQPAVAVQTGWQADPLDDCKEVPVFNYQCDTSGGTVKGVFNESQSRPDTCELVEPEHATHGDLDQVQDIECWRIRVCKLSGTPTAELAPEAQWLNKRWKEGDETCNTSGDPGKVKTYVAYCDDGIDPEGELHWVPGMVCLDACEHGGGSSGSGG